MKNEEIEELIYNFIEYNKESIECKINEFIHCEILYLEKHEIDNTIAIKCGLEICINNLAKSLIVELTDFLKYNDYITNKWISISQYYSQEDNQGKIRDYIYFTIYL